jgi:hypothetical protein
MQALRFVSAAVNLQLLSTAKAKPVNTDRTITTAVTKIANILNLLCILFPHLIKSIITEAVFQFKQNNCKSALKR